VVAVLASALGFIPLVREETGRLLTAVRNIGTVDLPGSYPGETWRVASRDDYRWLEDEWCFPSLRGFKSRFKFENDHLYRQNASSGPDSFVTKWEPVEVFKSNSGTIRLRASEETGWNAAFIVSGDRGASFRENERGVGDDGTITSGNRILALSCARCSIATDGLTYSCNGGA
jgi:hypothetical protein